MLGNSKSSDCIVLLWPLSIVREPLLATVWYSGRPSCSHCRCSQVGCVIAGEFCGASEECACAHILHFTASCCLLWAAIWLAHKLKTLAQTQDSEWTEPQNIADYSTVLEEEGGMTAVSFNTFCCWLCCSCWPCRCYWSCRSFWSRRSCCSCWSCSCWSCHSCCWSVGCCWWSWCFNHVIVIGMLLIMWFLIILLETVCQTSSCDTAWLRWQCPHCYCLCLTFSSPQGKSLGTTKLCFSWGTCTHPHQLCFMNFHDRAIGEGVYAYSYYVRCLTLSCNLNWCHLTSILSELYRISLNL